MSQIRDDGYEDRFYTQILAATHHHLVQGKNIYFAKFINLKVTLYYIYLITVSSSLCQCASKVTYMHPHAATSVLLLNHEWRWVMGRTAVLLSYSI